MPNDTAGGGCLLRYLKNREEVRLLPEEVVSLLNLPAKSKPDLNAIVSKVRSTLTARDDMHGLDRKFEIVKTFDVCVSCNNLITAPINKRRTSRRLGVAWCSKKCFRKLSPIAVELEMQWGRSIRDVLAWSISQCKSLETMSKLLLIDKADAEKLIRRHLSTVPIDLGFIDSSTWLPLSKRTGANPSDGVGKLVGGAYKRLGVSAPSQSERKLSKLLTEVLEDSSDRRTKG